MELIDIIFTTLAVGVIGFMAGKIVDELRNRF
jgi:hypothetical protein